MAVRVPPAPPRPPTPRFCSLARPAPAQYLFERCLGWNGLCIEAASSYHSRLIELRSCKLTPLCVANHTKAVDCIKAAGLGGIASTNKNLREAHVRVAPRRRVRCSRLATASRPPGAHARRLFEPQH